MLPLLLVWTGAGLAAPVTKDVDGTPLRSCATLDLFDEFVGVAPDGPSPPPGPEKSERGTMGNIAGTYTSDNFVLKWGPSGPVSDSDAAAILAAFELSFEVEVIGLDHDAPAGMDGYLFNVYVGDSGLTSGGAELSAYGAAGYYTSDSQGYPMIVLARGTVADPDYGKTTVAHEFYHAVQAATGSYTYSGDGAWFWESTAVWVEAEVYPTEPEYAVFLFGFAFYPYLAVNFFDYYDTGALPEYYQYGAFIFPRYLTEFEADASLIRDAWVDAGESGNDPLDRLDTLLLRDWATSVVNVFPDFAAANATWNYADNDVYEYYLDYYRSQYGAYDQGLTLELDASDLGTEISPPADQRPERFGTNYLLIDDPVGVDMVVEFTGDALGSAASPSSFAVSVVAVDGGQQTVHHLALDDGRAGTDYVGDVGDADDIYVVVTAWSDERTTGETFDYTLVVDFDDYDIDDTGAPGGTDGGDGGYTPGNSSFDLDDGARACGCAASPARGAIPFGAMLLGLVALGRRARWTP